MGRARSPGNNRTNGPENQLGDGARWGRMVSGPSDEGQRTLATGARAVQDRAILRRYRELARPDLPIRVLVTPDQAERHRALLRDVEIWTHEPTVADLDGFAASSQSPPDTSTLYAS